MKYTKTIRQIVSATRLAASGRFDLLCYKVRNVWYGLDFDFVSVDDLELSHDIAFYHSDSGGPDLVRVVKTLGVPIASAVVDMGSGKGGAIITLSKFPFERLCGVEISKDLVGIAERNAQQYGLARASFICLDARAFTDFDDYSHVYMANPFPCNVMEVVLFNLRQSLLRKPRRLTLIYKNPVCHDAVVKCGLFAIERTFAFPKCHHPFHVYIHLADSSVAKE